MSDPSVSDVDNDDIDKMIKGIDEFDDNLFSKSKQKSKVLPKEDPNKDHDPKLNGKKVKFEEDRTFGGTESKLSLKDNDNYDINVKLKPNIKKEIHFDNDDDILGSLESKPKSKSAKNVMDDIFGTEKTNNNSFMDDIFGENSAPKKRSTIESKNFILESKYSKPENDITESSSRRRRGNPTIGPSTIDTVLPENKQITSVPKDSPVKSNESENPFPWMSGKSTSQSQDLSNIGADISQNFIPSEKSPNSIPQNSSSLQQPSHQTNSITKTHISQQLSSENIGLNTVQIVDNKHQDIFNKELEIQNELLDRRRADYTLSLEKQRAEISNRYEILQGKQNQVKLWNMIIFTYNV